MKPLPKIILLPVSLLVLAALPTMVHAQSDEKPDAAEQAALSKEAKVPEATARATASAKVPGGTITKFEIEKEKGVLFWSYDFKKPGSEDTIEVEVNAMTGAIIVVTTDHDKE